MQDAGYLAILRAAAFAFTVLLAAPATATNASLTAWLPTADTKYCNRNCNHAFAGDGLCDCACLSNCPTEVMQAERKDCTRHTIGFDKTTEYLDVAQCYTLGYAADASLGLGGEVQTPKTADAKQGSTYTVFVSLSRAKNALWTRFANGIGALGNYEVRFTASLDMERTYLQAVMTYNSENPSVPISILTKFCGGNGACTTSDSANNGSSYAEAYKRGIAVNYLEYHQPLSNTTMTAGVHAGVKSSTVIIPDGEAGGEILGKIMCRGLGYEMHGRNIVVLKGSKGHGPCEDKIKGFKRGLASSTCAGLGHNIKWYFHAGYTRAKAKEVMGKVFVRDATVSAVFACNDDMALGTIDAARELGDKLQGTGSLVVLGYNNDTISQTFLKGQLEQLTQTKAVVPRMFERAVAKFSNVPSDRYKVRPSLYATVEQMDGFIAQARKLIHEQVSSGTTLGQVEEWRQEWHVQAETANIFVQTPTAPAFAENCKLGLPDGCPPKLAAAIHAMPAATNIVFGPLLSISLLMLMITGMTYIPTFIFLIKVAWSGHMSFANNISDANTPGVMAGDILYTASHNWLAVYAVICAWFAGFLWRLRKIPSIAYDYDPTSANYGALGESSFTTACASGMNDTTGVGYMSSLMAFLVVFRFVNMYQRVISARTQIGHAETALRRICVCLHGMVHPPERWDEPRCKESRRSMASMAKLAFGTFCLAVNDSEEKSRTMTSETSDNILGRVAKQYKNLSHAGDSKHKHLQAYIAQINTVEDMRAKSRSMDGLNGDGEDLFTAKQLQRLARRAEKERDAAIEAEGEGSNTKAKKTHTKAWATEVKRLHSKAEDKLKEEASGSQTVYSATSTSPYVQYKHKLRSLYMFACAQMLATIEDMATGKGEELRDNKFSSPPLIRNSPAQYGQLVIEIRGLMGGFLGTEQSIDIFRDRTETKHAYPMTITFISKIVLIVYCFFVAAAIGCKTSIESEIYLFSIGSFAINIGVAEMTALFTCFAFCTVFDTGSELQSPFGDDFSDLHLAAYERQLNDDVDSALQVGEGYEYERPAVTQRTAHAHGLFNRIQNEVLTKDFPGASAHMVRGVVNKWVEETENEAQEAEEAEDPEAQAAGFRGRLFSTVPPNASPRLKAVFGHTAEASRAAASSSGREQQLQYQQLRELKQLKDEGILTEPEYDEHKALVLQNMREMPHDKPAGSSHNSGMATGAPKGRPATRQLARKYAHGHRKDASSTPRSTLRSYANLETDIAPWTQTPPARLP